MEGVREEALVAIEEIFGDRLKRRQPGNPGPDGALASVFPTSPDEARSSHAWPIATPCP